MSTFAPATRHQLRARIALDGPTGSGKTWSALAWATVLADGGRIAVVDTERGSAQLYSDRFAFDVLDFRPPYDPRRLAEILRAAEAEGYAVVVLDSLSHFWTGEGGTLDIVEAAGSRSGGGNRFAGWSVGTPALRGLVDTMLAIDAHVVATMRSKMEHVLVEDDRGKQVPTRVGLAPVMRADLEYEFTVCISYDLDHRGTVTKSRAEGLADRIVQPGRLAVDEAAEEFLSWLRTGEPAPDLVDEDRRAQLRAWANGLPRDAKREVMGAWPPGLPPLADPQLTAAQAEQAAAHIASIAGEPDDTSDESVHDQRATADDPQLRRPSGEGTEDEDGTPDEDAGDTSTTTEDELEPVLAEAIDTALLALEPLAPRDLVDDLNERGLTASGDVATLRARLVVAILAEDDIRATQAQVKDRAKTSRPDPEETT